MLEGGGFEVVDLGVDVAPERFVAAAEEKNAQIIAMSALLTTTMPGMRTTLEAIEQAGIRERVKVMVGGAPVTQRFADEIGADGFSDNASGAVRIARELIGAAQVAR
jgi:methanogenic corrinoid protein MtbC1